MKKVLFAALALVFAASCNTAPKTTTTDATEAKTEVTSADIVFVRTDAVFAESEIFKTEGVALQAKNEKTQDRKSVV